MITKLYSVPPSLPITEWSRLVVARSASDPARDRRKQPHGQKVKGRSFAAYLISIPCDATGQEHSDRLEGIHKAGTGLDVTLSFSLSCSPLSFDRHSARGIRTIRSLGRTLTTHLDFVIRHGLIPSSYTPIYPPCTRQSLPSPTLCRRHQPPLDELLLSTAMRNGIHNVHSYGW